ncbi:FAD-dependent oxidoreductase [Haladaptatus halobius]|uniref:FAD-dependent oxidoreductase n=1 Tax=Haladaptatus halobius TaxID=2884875 RepID=UPI001D0B4C34|nr:FAD-dependent oxidoreductase [Haladaptatus halobius]
MSNPFVVIGGDAAGMSAASKAKRDAPDLNVVVFEKGSRISYGACGLPYYVKGEIESLEELISVTPEEAIQERGIDLRLSYEVTAIDRSTKTVTAVSHENGETVDQSYDDLLIATGARAVVPPVDGRDLTGVFTLHSLDDGRVLRAALESQPDTDSHPVEEISILEFLRTTDLERIGIIGGGVLGIELAEAFAANDLAVHLFQRGTHLLSPFGETVAREVEDHLREYSIELYLEATVEQLVGENEQIVAVETSGETVPVDMVVFATGVVPNVKIAADAGVELGPTGAIRADEYGRTNDEHIYAAGDCAEAIHIVTGDPVYAPLALTANRHGRAVGQTVTGTPTPVGQIAGTTAVKAFDLEIARTGTITFEDEARSAGFDPVSRVITAGSRSGYYPGGSPITIELVGDRQSGRILGAGMVGSEGVAKRIDTVVTALSAEMTATQVERLDLSYTPPISPVWDPVLIAARVLQTELDTQLAEGNGGS